MRIEEREGLLRVARYSARAPMAESRLRYDTELAEVELVTDRNDGPYAGVHRMTVGGVVAAGVHGRRRGVRALRRRVREHRDCADNRVDGFK